MDNEQVERAPLNFSIQDTMEMGMGNQELLTGLFAPEEEVKPEEITPIIKEAKEEIPKKEEKPKGKEIVQKAEGEELIGQDIVSNFLGDNNEEDETPAEQIAEKSKETTSETEEEATDTTFTSLAKDLVQLGVFTVEEGEEDVPITNGQELLDRFNAEKQKGAIEMVDNFIGKFGEDYQNAFEAIFVKGVNPKEYFGVYNNIVNFAELNLVGDENEPNQISVVRQMLTDQGMEPEDITTEIERLKNYGDLEAVSTKYHKVLIKKEAAKLKEKEDQSENELRQKTLLKNQYIQNVQTVLQDKLKEKEFDGIPLNPKLANELQDFLLVDKWKTPSGELLTDFDRMVLDLKKPENHSTKVKFALLLKILEKDPTLSTIKRSGITKKSDDIFDNLAGQKSKTSGKQANTSATSSPYFKQL